MVLARGWKKQTTNNDFFIFGLGLMAPIIHTITINNINNLNNQGFEAQYAENILFKTNNIKYI